MIEIVGNFLKKYNLQNKTILVGFSGGYDSMCLLDILSKLKEQEDFWDLRVIAAHFNHNWRGEESKKEQEVCKLFASGKGFEFYTKTAPLPKKKTENDARIARYEFFEDALDYYEADGILTAHNKDDNAETVLYRVIKGTGIIGLQGISERRDYYYRPLLHVPRSEILKYCEKNNLTPNDDSSNKDISYKRNYLRLSVLPALESINPSVKESLNTLAEVCRNENSILEEYLSPIRERVFYNDKIVPSQYIKLSKPVKMRLIHEYIQKFNLDYDLKKVKELYNFIEDNITQRNGKTLSLATALWLYVDEKTIETIPPKEKHDKNWININIDKEGEFTVGKNKFILKKYVDKDVFVFPPSTAKFVYVDLSEVSFPFKLRTRNDGDLINPFGMSGAMKLKKYLNAKGISRHNRDNLLIFAKDDEAMWVVGVGLNNKISVKEKPTHVIEFIETTQNNKNI